MKSAFRRRTSRILPGKWERVRLHLDLEEIEDGEGFQWFVRDLGRSMEVDGIVRLEEGDEVSVIAEGPRDVLEEFLETIRSVGNGYRPKEVHIRWSQATGQYRGFEARY
jgi:acylphosphatase